ncbi:MAG: DUF1294 domain-containing protein [Methanoregula sp.]|jgi:uncharacterized membrane protein YsdA (DUF1294 family)
MDSSLFVLLPALYIVVNSIAFLSFAYDKHKTRNNGWRISEGTLLVLAFLGPFGAYGAMLMFRHKTRKIKFYLVPLFLVLHIVGMIYLAAMELNLI